MATNEKITFIGNTVLIEDEHRDYVNFYPQYKLENKIIIPLDESEKKEWCGGYNQINIGFREPEPPELYQKYKPVLSNYGNEICIISIVKNDRLQINDKLRLPFCDLMESNDIKIVGTDDSDFYKVTETKDVIDWKNDISEKPLTIKVEDELEGNRKYFLECDDGKFRGPFEYRLPDSKTGISRECLFVPKNQQPHVIDKYYIIEKGIDDKDEKIIYLPKDSIILTPPQKNDNSINDDLNTKPSETAKNVVSEDINKQRNYICEELQQYRNYTKNEIYNILICITQGFLTVFAGEPGTGKTSICDTIAKILGLSNADSDKNRYLSISVERGWSSKNDLIGYYNPLTEKFTDNTGLYTVLTELDKEGEVTKDSKPYWVLLDEANLSQMEHYWASFIKLADADARKETKLTLAPSDAIDVKSTVSVPDTLKFLATINNDHTTESLSPRLLDRAWVITLPRPTCDFSNKNVKKLYEDGISWNTLTRLFGFNMLESTPLFEFAKNEIGFIYELYAQHKRIVSPRSKLAIEGYLKVALDCFEGADVVTTAIDFIIMQKLLPMLNGYISDAFADELQVILDKYPLSAEKFKDMRSQNDNINTTYISFFM